jgi:hypothetical protein
LGVAGAGHVVASICFLYLGAARWAFHDRSFRFAFDDTGLLHVQGGASHVLLTRLVSVPWSTTRSAGQCSAAEACPLQPTFTDVAYAGVFAIGHRASHHVWHSPNSFQAPTFSQPETPSVRSRSAALRRAYSAKSAGSSILWIVGSEIATLLQMQRKLSTSLHSATQFSQHPVQARTSQRPLGECTISQTP